MRNATDLMDSLARVGRFGDGVAGMLQSESEHTTQAVFVFNKKDVRHQVSATCVRKAELHHLPHSAQCQAVYFDRRSSLLEEESGEAAQFFGSYSPPFLAASDFESANLMESLTGK